MGQKQVAEILVIYPTSGRTWMGRESSTVEIRSWKLTVPPDAQAEILRDMVEVKGKIIMALDAKNPNILPPVPGWILDEFPGADPGEFNEKEEERFPFYYGDLEAQYEVRS